MVDYTGINYSDTEIFAIWDDDDYEIIGSWDSVNMRSIAEYTFDPKEVNDWDTTYSWLMVELKLNLPDQWDGTGEIIVASDLADGVEEIVYDLSGETITDAYDKLRLLFADFVDTGFDHTGMCRVTIWMGGLTELQVRWRKARIVHTAMTPSYTSWVSGDYVTVTLDHSVVPNDVTSVPVRVVFDESNAAFPLLMRDHKDSIIILDEDDNEVYFMIESWEPTTCVLWLMVNSISSTVDTVLRIYYDTTGAMVNTESKVTTIWRTKTVAMLAMNESDNVIVDQSQTGYVCTPYGCVYHREHGLDCMTFNGTPGRIELPYESSLQMMLAEKGTMTFELIPETVVQGDHACLYSRASADDSANQAMSLKWAGSNIVAEFSNYTDGKTTITTAAPTVVGKTVITFTWESNSCSIWINGTKVTTSSVPTLDSRNDLPMMLFGKTYGDEYDVEEYFEGTVYSVVVFNEVPSDDRIAVDHANKLGTLVTISGVPALESVYTSSVEFRVLSSPKDAVDVYQLDVVVHCDNGISRFEDVYLNGGCRTDCLDVMFVDPNGAALHATIVETDGASYARYVVAVTDIPESGYITCKLLYGWSDAYDISEPETVFEDFDSFGGTTLNRRWTISGSPTLGDDELTLSDSDAIIWDRAYTTEVEVVFRALVTEQDSAVVEVRDALEYTNRIALYNDDDIEQDVFTKMGLEVCIDGADTVETKTVNNSKVYHFYGIVRYATLAVVRQDDISFTLTESLPAGELYPAVSVWDTTQESTTVLDFFMVRKCYENPPIIAWWGDITDKFMFSKTVTIDASLDGAFSEYQLDLTIHRDEGTDSGSDVYVSTHCRADYRDFVFVDSSSNVLTHWVDTYDDESANVVVKFIDIPSSGSVTFTMYYKSNYVGRLSDYKGTIGSGRESTTNPPSISSWGTDTLLEDLSSYAYIKTFTISDIPEDGWFGITAIINRLAGTDNLSRAYIGAHCNVDYGDLIFTTLDDSVVLGYDIFVIGSTYAVLKILMKLVTTDGQVFNMRYGKQYVDNQTDMRPVIAGSAVA